ncbi:hypothetical protein PYCC9005_000115 [Savitreella phatthalungensis]
MPKDKPLSVNPALAYHKKAKDNSIRKARAEKTRLRDEKLVHRRPTHVQRQIDDLKKLAENSTLSKSDEKRLANLEQDLKRITQLQGSNGKQDRPNQQPQTRERSRRKQKHSARLPADPTRSVFYDPVYNPYGAPPPGEKQRWKDDPEDIDASVEDDSSDVEYIPFPPGTPPPAPAHATTISQSRAQSQRPANDTVKEPVTAPVAPVRTSYAAAPALRDLRSEATTFVPQSLKRTIAKIETPNTLVVEHEDNAKDPDSERKVEQVQPPDSPQHTTEAELRATDYVIRPSEHEPELSAVPNDLAVQESSAPPPKRARRINIAP